MPLVPKPPATPTKVEDLFYHDGTDNVAYLVAVLRDHSELFLSDGPGQQFPSVWPLWYEPYTIEHPGALEWIERRRARLLELRPDLIDVYDQPHLRRGLGHFVEISGLEIGAQPWMKHTIYEIGRHESPQVLDEDRYLFPSKIANFIPAFKRPTSARKE